MITIKLPKSLQEFTVVLPSRSNPDAGLPYTLKFIDDYCFSIVIDSDKPKYFEAVTECNVYPLKNMTGVLIPDYLKIYVLNNDEDSLPKEAHWSPTISGMLPKVNIYVQVRDDVRIITIDE